jgi:hypothetical protein
MVTDWSGTWKIALGYKSTGDFHKNIGARMTTYSNYGDIKNKRIKNATLRQRPHLIQHHETRYKSKTGEMRAFKQKKWTD